MGVTFAPRLMLIWSEKWCKNKNVWIISISKYIFSFLDLHHLLGVAIRFSHVYWWIQKRCQNVHFTIHITNNPHSSDWIYLQYGGTNSWTLYYNLPSFHEIQVIHLLPDSCSLQSLEALHLSQWGWGPRKFIDNF